MKAIYDLKIDDAIAQITLKIENDICDTWKIKREDVTKALQAQQRIDNTIKFVKSLNDKGQDCDIYYDIKKEILSHLQDEEVK